MSNDPAHAPLLDAARSARYPKRAAAAVLMTAGLGPLIGCVPVAIVMGQSSWRARQALAPGPTVETWGSFAESMIAAAYMLGGMPALLAAVPISVMVWRNGTIGYAPVLMSAALGCLLSAGPIALLWQIPLSGALMFAGLLLAPALFAATVGRWLVACMAATFIK